MKRESGFTLLELVVILLIVVILLSIFFPARSKMSKIASRVVCGTSVKGLGSAFEVYANDYEGNFPQLPGTGPWSKQLGFAYDLAKPDFKEGGAQRNVDRTITASMYFLVRYADVSPKSFVCNIDREKKRIDFYDGKNPANRKIEELWDFGPDPYKHISYAMHNPYGAFPATNSRSMKFALLADMNPWFNQGDIVPPTISRWRPRKNVTQMPPYFSDTMIPREQIMPSNAMAHGREGQCVAFVDGHSEFVKTPDVGINHDNIYTYWSTPNNPTENDIRIGTNPTSRSKENDAQSPDDSFLAI